MVGSFSLVVKYIVAVMKKFHGKRVPKPRMKKMSHTALYLSRGVLMAVMVLVSEVEVCVQCGFDRGNQVIYEDITDDHITA